MRKRNPKKSKCHEEYFCTWIPGHTTVGVSGADLLMTQENCREMFANWPPKTSDLDPFTCVLKLHTRHMLGAETRTKVKGKMNT